MTEKERKEIGKRVLEDSYIVDVIDYFGADKLLNEMDDNDVAERVDYGVLRQIDDDSLFEAIGDDYSCLSRIHTDSIIEYLERDGYIVTDTCDEQKETLDQIADICRDLQPNGYIDKERAKKLICDYLDFWMNSTF